MLPKGPIHYRHLTVVGSRSCSRNFRQEDGCWPWHDLMQRWLVEPSIHIHHRRKNPMMAALGGRKDRSEL